MKNVEKALEFVYQISGKQSEIDPLNLAELLGITVIDNYQMDKDGYLVCSEGVKLIFVSNRVSDKHRRRFVISHEIGHFLMHPEQLYCCSDIGENTLSRINSPIQEKEANEFASEMLLPTSEMVKRLPKGHLTLSIISQIADLYNVSLTMAAMKAVWNSNTEDEILLCYEDNRLKWYATGNKELCRTRIPERCPMELNRNSNFASLIGYWDDLYIGPVSQEVFNPFGNQFLVLLVGEKWNDLEED